MSNKEELEKYKKELADMEAKDKQQNENDKSLENSAKQENDTLDEMEDGYTQTD